LICCVLCRATLDLKAPPGFFGENATMRMSLVIGLMSIALLLQGCGGAAGFVPVSGKVTLDGQPLEGASVQFHPKEAEAEGSYGKTDAEGKYTLKRASDDATGAAVGEHDVTISKTTETDPADDLTPQDNLVPEQAQRHTFTVPAAGTNAANFDLKSK